jgi:hypothetical protein
MRWIGLAKAGLHPAHRHSLQYPTQLRHRVRRCTLTAPPVSHTPARRGYAGLSCPTTRSIRKPPPCALSRTALTILKCTIGVPQTKWPPANPRGSLAVVPSVTRTVALE